MKTIELEWEPVEKAGGYEVRLTPKTKDLKPIKILTAESKLIQEVPVGNYTMHIRTRAKDVDYMSPWSEAIPLEVLAKEITPLKPEDKSSVNAVGLSKYTVEFEWQPVDKVKEYTLKVWNEHRRDRPWVFVTKNTKKKLEVPPGDVYYWQVLFESASPVSYAQDPTTFTFTILGMKLTTPQIFPPEPKPVVNELSWRESEGADVYHAKLYFRFLDETNWRLVKQVETDAVVWPFTKRLPPGAYRVDVKATARRRTDSDLAQLEFVVKPSDVEIRQAMK